MSVANVKHIQIKENKPSARCNWDTNGLHYLIKVKARVWISSCQQKEGQSRGLGEIGYWIGVTLPKKGPGKHTSRSGIHMPLMLSLLFSKQMQCYIQDFQGGEITRDLDLRFWFTFKGFMGHMARSSRSHWLSTLSYVYGNKSASSFFFWFSRWFPFIAINTEWYEFPSQVYRQTEGFQPSISGAVRTISIQKDIPAEFHGGQKQFRVGNRIRSLMRASQPLGLFQWSGQSIGEGPKVLCPAQVWTAWSNGVEWIHMYFL